MKISNSITPHRPNLNKLSLTVSSPFYSGIFKISEKGANPPFWNPNTFSLGFMTRQCRMYVSTPLHKLEFATIDNTAVISQQQRTSKHR